MSFLFNLLMLFSAVYIAIIVYGILFHEPIMDILTEIKKKKN